MSFTGDGYLEEIAKQLARIANSLEAMNRLVVDGKIGISIKECPVIKIRSN